MKRKVFAVIDDSKELITEEKLNKDGNPVYSRTYSDIHQLYEKFSTYDEDGCVIEEIEKEDGVEIYRNTYEYDDEKDIASQHQYINGELYESMINESQDNIFISKTIQEGEVISKVEHEMLSDDEWKLTFYNGEDISEIQIGKRNIADKSSVEETYLENGELHSTTRQKFDDEERLIFEETVNKDGRILSSSRDTYENDLLVNIYSLTDDERFEEYNMILKYDDNKNLIKREVVQLDGQCIALELFEYDDKNRVVAERGYSSNHPYTEYFNDQNYNVIIEWDDSDD